MSKIIMRNVIELSMGMLKVELTHAQWQLAEAIVGVYPQGASDEEAFREAVNHMQNVSGLSRDDVAWCMRAAYKCIIPKRKNTTYVEVHTQVGSRTLIDVVSEDDWGVALDFASIVAGEGAASNKHNVATTLYSCMTDTPWMDSSRILNAILADNNH